MRFDFLRFRKNELHHQEKIHDDVKSKLANAGAKKMT